MATSRPQHGQTQPIGMLLAIIDRASRMAANRRLRPLGMDLPSLTHLMAVEAAGPSGTSQDDIARALLLNKGTVARGIAKLEERGLVQRAPRLGNRRMNVVTLTERGRRLTVEVRAKLDPLTEALTQGFAPSERRRLLNDLRRVADNALEAAAAEGAVTAPWHEALLVATPEPRGRGTGRSRRRRTERRRKTLRSKKGRGTCTD